MLENFAEYFYNPLVFWTAPLLLVVLGGGWRWVNTWRLRRHSESRPDDDSGDST